HPSWSPSEIKALLVNTAETGIFTDPVKQPGVLAPITRIGGGEVRVNRAFAGSVGVWDANDLTPSLSFGYDAVGGAKNFHKTVEVHNYSDTGRTFSITPSFRFAADAASGAIDIDAPAGVFVAGNASASFNLNLKADASRLPVWTLNGGNRGGDGFRLQDVEFD